VLGTGTHPAPAPQARDTRVNLEFVAQLVVLESKYSDNPHIQIPLVLEPALT